MVTKAPQADQIKIVRMLASKTALAARVDACRTQPDGGHGEKLKEDIIMRYNKISAPGQSKLAKILPKPIDKPRKKSWPDALAKTPRAGHEPPNIENE